MPNNSRSIDAGRLNEPVEILALRETEPTVWAYVPAGRAWAAALSSFAEKAAALTNRATAVAPTHSHVYFW